MAPQSSVLTWRIPWTAEPGGLPSVGSHRVGHDWSDLAAAAAVIFRGTGPRVEWYTKAATVIQSAIQGYHVIYGEGKKELRPRHHWIIFTRE